MTTPEPTDTPTPPGVSLDELFSDGFLLPDTETVPKSWLREIKATLAAQQAEIERLRSVEAAAAAYVRAGLCGNYEIPAGGDHQEKLAALIAAVRTNGAFDA